MSLASAQFTWMNYCIFPIPPGSFGLFQDGIRVHGGWHYVSYVGIWCEGLLASCWCLDLPWQLSFEIPWGWAQPLDTDWWLLLKSAKARVCVCMCVCVRAHACAHARSIMSNSLWPPPWTAAHQVPLSMGFSRQEYWSVAIPFSRGSFQPRDWTHVSHIVGRFFTTEPPGKRVESVKLG